MAGHEKELFFAHSLDIVWIIALWHWIHGGDPYPEEQAAETTELIARGLVGHLSGTKAKAPTDAVEKLAKLGMKVMMHVEGKPNEIKSTKEFYEVSERLRFPTKTCIRLGDGSEFCWGGLFWPPWAIPVISRG
jgi:ABC-type glycerol-3-phosphate transport system substrate-binding protein